MTSIRLIACAGATALLLAACGGGSSYSPPEEPLQQREDRAASASVEGLMAFVRALVGGGERNEAEPRPVDGITPPASDTAEPQPL
jgi:hypothetical protein